MYSLREKVLFVYIKKNSNKNIFDMEPKTFVI